MVKLHKRLGEIMKRTKWSLTIHDDDQGKRSVISESTFNHFAEVHATMKINKGKAFVMIIPKTAKPMEIQAFHNLRQSGVRRRSALKFGTPLGWVVGIDPARSGRLSRTAPSGSAQ